jgi:monoamine oxidase
MPYELETELEAELEAALEFELGAALERGNCSERLKSTKVAVVGGGLAGLMAARQLSRDGVKVTVFEARKQVGGRVLSNRNFSNGRITEAGAELIASFHTRWLDVAQEYEMTVVSRMSTELYEQARLNVKLTLDKALSQEEVNALQKAEDYVLGRIASDAAQYIYDSYETQPWRQPTRRAELQKFDKMSVADALTSYYGVIKDSKTKYQQFDVTHKRLWMGLELLLVNDEVSPLEKMNFLGLLCKVKAGQQVNDKAYSNPMGYWHDLEIFRCADGCDTMATKIADEILARPKANSLPNVMRNTAVTRIELSRKDRVKVGFKKVISDDGKLAPGQVDLHYDYVILTIPPSVWSGVEIKVEGKTILLKDEIGSVGMGDCVKFFSNMKKRFWIAEKDKAHPYRGSAPYGGSSTLGQVWEGTDNQTRVGDQGIVLSVFAGPILKGRVPTPFDFDLGLKRLYRDYASNLKKPRLFSDWPNEPFIKTGYASPETGQIFRIGDKFITPFRDRLFFAGEHTHMAFFGYMEGALRSGIRAANDVKNVIQQACAGHGHAPDVRQHARS